MRSLGKTGLALLLTLAFTYVLSCIVIAVLVGKNVVAVAIEDAWYVLFSGGAVAFGLFALFLLIANVVGRRRGSGSQFWINLGSLIVALVVGTLVTVFAGVLVSTLSAGFAGISTLDALLVAGELFVAGILALALTHFVIFKPRATEFEP